MVEPDDPESHVCPACGAQAGEAPFCSGCGHNLTRVKRLPTRREWAAKHAPAPANQSATEAAVASWIRTPRNRLIAGVAAIVVAAAILIPALTGGESTASRMTRLVNKSYATHGTTCRHEEGEHYVCEMETQRCSGTLTVKPEAGSFTIVEARPEELRAPACDNPGGE
jgi:hypothetical protein